MREEVPRAPARFRWASLVALVSLSAQARPYPNALTRRRRQFSLSFPSVFAQPKPKGCISTAALANLLPPFATLPVLVGARISALSIGGMERRKTISRPPLLHCPVLPARRSTRPLHPLPRDSPCLPPVATTGIQRGCIGHSRRGVQICSRQKTVCCCLVTCCWGHHQRFWTGFLERGAGHARSSGSASALYVGSFCCQESSDSENRGHSCISVGTYLYG